MRKKHLQDSFHTQELQELIPIVLKMLDVLHTLPFQTDWQRSHLIQTVIKFLKSAELLTLTAWKSPNPKKYLQSWNLSQKRHQESLFNLYCRIAEQLLSWSSQVSEEWISSKDLWQDYGFFVLVNDPRVKNYFHALPHQEHQIARYYLHCTQSVFQVHFEELIRRLFIWISHWTKESYFLPTLKSQANANNPNQLSDLQKWKAHLFESEDWGLFASDYLTLLQPNQME